MGCGVRRTAYNHVQFRVHKGKLMISESHHSQFRDEGKVENLGENARVKNRKGYSSRRLNLSPAGSAVSRSRRGFRTSQVESAIPLGPLDLGKIVLSQTREMQNILCGALHVSPNMAHCCADVVSGRRSRSTTSCETAHHHEGNFASPGIGPDAFFLGRASPWAQLIPTAAFWDLLSSELQHFARSVV